MKLLLTLTIIASLISCGQRQANLANEKQNITKCWKDWENKGATGDPAYYWTDDVVLMGPAGPTIKGKEEFLKLFANMHKIPGFKMIWDAEPSTIEVSKDGQMAYLFAKNKMTMTDSTGAASTVSNQAIQIWKKDKEGNWRAAVSVMYPEASTK